MAKYVCSIICRALHELRCASAFNFRLTLFCPLIALNWHTHTDTHTCAQHVRQINKIALQTFARSRSPFCLCPLCTTFWRHCRRDKPISQKSIQTAAEAKIHTRKHTYTQKITHTKLRIKLSIRPVVQGLRGSVMCTRTHSEMRERLCRKWLRFT